MITELDIAWLAGILDGEGWFVLFKDKRANRGINCHVGMAMVDLMTIEHAAKLLRILSGDRVKVRPRQPKSGFSKRSQYTIDVSSKNGCLRTLLAVQPYLVTKRLQGDLVISILHRAVNVRKYQCDEMDYAMMKVNKRLKKHDDGGEARAEAVRLLGQVTPSQAILRLAPRASDRMEGVETRRVRRNDNPVHERPAPTASAEGEDIVQTPDESPGSGLNSPTTKSVH